MRASRLRRARRAWPDTTFPITSIPRWIQTIGVVLSIGAILSGRFVRITDLHVFHVLAFGSPLFVLALLAGFAERWRTRVIASVLLLAFFAFALLLRLWLEPTCLGVILTITLLTGVGRRRKRPRPERAGVPSKPAGDPSPDGDAGD